jgi:hypothetical protein
MRESPQLGRRTQQGWHEVWITHRATALFFSGGRRGPRLVLSDQPQSSGMVQVSEPDEEVDRRVLAIAIPPEEVTALVCSHAAYADAEWSDRGLQKLEFVREDQS